MLFKKPEDLMFAVDEAIEFRRLFTDLSMDLIRRCAGSGFRTDWAPSHPVHEAHEYEFLRSILPQLVYSAPRWQFDTDLPGWMDDVIEAMQHGMNQVSRKQKIEETLQDIARDQQFGYGVGCVTLSRSSGYDPDESAYWPTIRRVSPFHFFQDPHATDWREGRFRGHVWTRPREMLLAAKDDAGKPLYNPDVVNALATDIGEEEYVQRGIHADRVDRGARFMVYGLDVYVPEDGVFYSLAIHQEKAGKGKVAGWLRQPRRAVTHPEGPYVLFGSTFLTDQVYPLGSLAVTATLVDELNAHCQQASEDAASAKRLIAVDSNQKGLLTSVATARSGTVVGIPGLRDGAAQAFEFGGTMAATVAYIGLLRERLDRVSALSDIARGNISGQATATEINVAQAAADMRTKLEQQTFRRGVIRLGERSAWLMYEQPAVRFHVPWKDPATGKQIAKEFIGGRQPGAPPFDALQLSVAPFSMENIDPRFLQQRMERIVQIVVSILPSLLNNPVVKPRELLDDLMESVNVQDGGERYIDFQQLDAIRNATLGLVAPGMGTMPPAGPGAGMAAESGDPEIMQLQRALAA